MATLIGITKNNGTSAGIPKNTEGYILTPDYQMILVGEEEDQVLLYAEDLTTLTGIPKN